MDAHPYDAGLPADRDTRYAQTWATIGTIVVIVAAVWLVASLK